MTEKKETVNVEKNERKMRANPKSALFKNIVSKYPLYQGNDATSKGIREGMRICAFSLNVTEQNIVFSLMKEFNEAIGTENLPIVIGKFAEHQ